MPTPQQAAVKKPQFKAAASAPSTLARLDSPSRRKKNPAASPRRSKVNGVKNLAHASVLRLNRMAWLMDRLLLTLWVPMEFRSVQLPWKFDHFACS